MVQSILVNIKSWGTRKITNQLRMVLLFLLADTKTKATEVKGLTTNHKVLEKEGRKD